MILKSSLQHDSPHVALGTLPKTVHWAFSSVNSHMLLQVVRKHKWLGTSFTKLYVFSTLGILIYRVLLQNPCSCKWFDILGTSIGFFALWILKCLFKLIDCAYGLEHFSSVNSHMLIQMAWTRKWLGTFWTTVGFLSIVNSCMPLQIDWLCKWFGTF